MYKIKRKSLTKIAGTNIPEDQKLWPAEVLKGLVSEHPYIDTGRIKIKFTRIEPETKTTMGKIIVGDAAAIPFSIRTNDKTKKLELDPLDILYDGESFQHLNEESLRRTIDRQQVGRLVKKEDSVPPSNRYIGDITGDVTPLEWSAYPSGFAGPRSTSAGQGLLSYVIKNQDDVSKLFNLLNTYDGINSSVEAMGLRDSLENLRDGMAEKIPTKRLAHIMKRPEGGFAVAFDGGDTRAVRAKELKVMLGGDFHPVMRHVMQRGWAMIRDFPTIRSVDSGALAVVPTPIESGGRYLIQGMDGKKMLALVCDQMIDFDGSVLKVQKAICEGSQCYAEGKAIQGWRVPKKIPRAFDEYKRQGALVVTKDYPLSSCDTSFPIGVIDTGVEGCFIDESWGTPKATPSFKIEKLICTPNDPDIMIARRTDTLEEIGLVIVPALVRPQKIQAHHFDKNLMPKNSYYIPDHMSFVETNGKMMISDKQAIVEGRPEALLRKNAGMYYLFGETEDGKVQYTDMSPDQARTKLAWLGATDDVIEKAMDMSTGQDITLEGLKEVEDVLTKVASEGVQFDPIWIERIKVAAEDAIQGIEKEEEARDPRTIDSILSLQFVSQENLEDLVESQEIFQEAEDRLARLLLAARQGEKSIHERGVQRALKGIGDARKSLKTLEIELESRNR